MLIDPVQSSPASKIVAVVTRPDTRLRLLLGQANGVSRQRCVLLVFHRDLNYGGNDKVSEIVAWAQGHASQLCTENVAVGDYCETSDS